MTAPQTEEAAGREEDERLAAQLGISCEELGQLDFDFTDLSTDDGEVELILEFSEGNPKHIMDKIKGLEDGQIVRLDASFFDSDDDDEDDEDNEDNDESLTHQGAR